MTFDEVGAPARLSGEPRERYEKNGRVTGIILVQKSSKSAQ